MADEVDPRVEMEVTLKFKYKTDPGNYELTGPPENMLQEIADFDKDIFTTEPAELWDMLPDADEPEITVTPVIND